MEWLSQRFELSRGVNAHNVRPMEGMRGFAVFLVFLVHYNSLVNPWIAGEQVLLVFSSALHTIGNTGVDLFFVLSGYLIYGSLISRPQPFLNFLSRRVERIYPTFIVVFIIYVLVSFAFPAENKIPASAYEGVIYLEQNFLLLPGLFPIEPMITVAWSLSYEMLYYLAIPIAITLFKMRDRSPIWRISFFLILAAVTVIYCAAYTGHVRLIMFVSGILLYEAIHIRSIPSPKSFLGLFALAFGLLATLLPMPGSGWFALKVSILFITFFVFCMTCFRDPSTWLAGAFSWTPMRWLGNMSYSYYLLHGLAIKAGFLALAAILPVTKHGVLMFWSLLPLMFALTLVPTTVLYLAIERPFSLSPRRINKRTLKSSPDETPANIYEEDATRAARNLP